MKNKKQFEQLAKKSNRRKRGVRANAAIKYEQTLQHELLKSIFGDPVEGSFEDEARLFAEALTSKPLRNLENI